MTHRAGLDGHRRGLLAVAQGYADKNRRLAAITLCGRCDADGWLWGAGEDGDPILCYHDNETTTEVIGQ